MTFHQVLLREVRLLQRLPAPASSLRTAYQAVLEQGGSSCAPRTSRPIPSCRNGLRRRSARSPRRSAGGRSRARPAASRATVPSGRARGYERAGREALMQEARDTSRTEALIRRRDSRTAGAPDLPRAGACARTPGVCCVRGKRSGSHLAAEGVAGACVSSDIAAASRPPRFRGRGIWTEPTRRYAASGLVHRGRQPPFLARTRMRLLGGVLCACGGGPRSATAGAVALDAVQRISALFSSLLPLTACPTRAQAPGFGVAKSGRGLRAPAVLERYSDQAHQWAPRVLFTSAEWFTRWP